VFDAPTDNLSAVFGTPLNPLTLMTDDPLGFVSTVGGDLPPDSSLFGVQPARQWDSFYTIGRASYDGTMEASAGVLSIGLPALGGQMSFTTNNGSWFVAGFPAQGQPDMNGRVLILQLVVRDGYTISGSINLQWDADGMGGQASVTEMDIEIGHPVPAPGALALLGLAGVMSGRQRRRRA
jgi:hypothetical protein